MVTKDGDSVKHHQIYTVEAGSDGEIGGFMKDEPLPNAPGNYRSKFSTSEETKVDTESELA
ncbi:hypothetical protein NGM10_17650 (plasmid) [Halorussus salilacus]|uniref:hypothetical protein n=1 Tax=Halorussus salilacus TaxID=2953750 RepID=UPI00209D821F|nr:hypothetical protein [Halorussus salilacus]USZ70022.1 hypothetical protein NGM10_17650 [Halorussus salilacus]